MNGNQVAEIQKNIRFKRERPLLKIFNVMIYRMKLQMMMMINDHKNTGMIKIENQNQIKFYISQPENSNCRLETIKRQDNNNNNGNDYGNNNMHV